MTRAKAARSLGVGISTVRRMEERGELHPAIDPATRERLFDPGEIARVAASRDREVCGGDPTAPPMVAAVWTEGDLAAAVFELLDAGQTLVSIVVELHAPPEQIEKAAQAWCRLKEQDLNSPSVPASIGRLRRQVAELVAAYKGLKRRLDGTPQVGLGDNFKCRTCGVIGSVALPVRCTACGDETEVGWWPPAGGNR
ncbi:MAG: MerR family transcriptional regulator [Deltaproteobacteria bacterium]|nr:MerR family transcriptional regulator [Deltaproteobacteria bacterium]